ncbi:MAG TPA: hypothetical protein VF629_05985 [Hymenobacter sp.]|jgi:hypothetical protein|uniref:hypothetical protein n=1 Tax=Hymenobacter sp. TaxID=1898978 RepID=UPI002EDA5496
MTLTQSITRIALATALLLLIPLAAKFFLPGMGWDVFDFVFAGVLLFGTGLTYVLIARKWNNTVYRVAVGVAVLAGLLLVWANAAVGLVGSEDNPANLLYAGVLAVALMGAIVARFRPLGMSRAMFGAAIAYVLVTVVALFVWTPTGVGAEPSVPRINELAANGAFAALWAFAGWLFQRAASMTNSDANRQLA